MITIIMLPFKKIFRWQLPLTFAAIGFLNFFTLFILTSDLFFLLAGVPLPNSLIFISTFSCCFWGFYNAQKGPVVNEVIIPFEKLANELEDLKIIQISDLHIGPTISKQYVEKVIKLINSLNPDIITLTGDIGDGPVKDNLPKINSLRFLKAKYGTFFVTGNHEYYWDANEWLNILNNNGVINLINRSKIIYHNKKSILIFGIPDPVSRLSADFSIIQNIPSEEMPDFKILLSHRPGIANAASSVGFDLQLSGHTHAGQFFPWTIVVKWVHKINKGLHKVGNMWIYVNQGTGSWGPQLRLGTTTEVTLLVLKKKLNEITSF